MNVLPPLGVLTALVLLTCAGLRLPAAQPAGQSQPTELFADLIVMTSTDTETRVICTGNVVLTGTNLRIACDRLEVVATRIGDPNDTLTTLEKFKYLLATGNVRLHQDQREVTCQRAEVLPAEEIVILSGAPVLIDHLNDVTVGTEVDHANDYIAAGAEIILRRGQRQVEIKGARVTAPEIKDLGAEAGTGGTTQP